MCDKASANHFFTCATSCGGINKWQTCHLEAIVRNICRWDRRGFCWRNTPSPCPCRHWFPSCHRGLPRADVTSISNGWKLSAHFGHDQLGVWIPHFAHHDYLPSTSLCKLTTPCELYSQRWVATLWHHSCGVLGTASSPPKISARLTSGQCQLWAHLPSYDQAHGIRVAPQCQFLLSTWLGAAHLPHSSSTWCAVFDPSAHSQYAH